MQTSNSVRLNLTHSVAKQKKLVWLLCVRFYVLYAVCHAYIKLRVSAHTTTAGILNLFFYVHSNDI